MFLGAGFFYIICTFIIDTAVKIDFGAYKVVLKKLVRIKGPGCV